MLRIDLLGRTYQAPLPDIDSGVGGGDGGAVATDPAPPSPPAEPMFDGEFDLDTDPDAPPAAEGAGDPSGEEPPAAERAASDAGDEDVSPFAEYPEALLDRAAQQGMMFDDIASLGSQAALEWAVRMKETQAAQPGGTPPAPAPSQEPAAPEADLPEAPDFDKMLEDGESEAVVSMLRQMHEQNVAMRQQMAQSQQTAAELAAAQKQREIQNTIKGLGEEYAPVVGKDPNSVHRTSREHQNQVMIERVAGYIEEGLKRDGASPMSTADLVQLALAGVAGNHQSQIARSQLRTQIRQNGTQVTAPPNPTSDPQVTGDEAAVAAVEQKLREFGAS